MCFDSVMDEHRPFGSAKQVNHLGIMDKSMLTGEIKPSPNSSSHKDFVMVVIALKGLIQFFEALCVVDIAVGNVTEFQEGS